MKLPKLNLRDLFWLVVVVALGLKWWMDRQAFNRLAAENDHLTHTLKSREDTANELLHYQKFIHDGLSSDGKKDWARVEREYDQWWAQDQNARGTRK